MRQQPRRTSKPKPTGTTPVAGPIAGLIRIIARQCAAEHQANKEKEQGRCQ